MIGPLPRRAMLGSIAASLVSSRAEGAERLVFGVVPQQAPSLLAKIWIPVLAEASRMAGIAIEFATAPDIPTFERRLIQGAYHLAYVNPYHMVVIDQEAGWRAFARAKDEGIRGIIACRRDFAGEGLAALDGNLIVYPSPAAFAATLIPYYELERQGVRFEKRYVGSHDSVYMAVRDRFALAGGGIERTFEMAAPVITTELRILWRSAAYTSHAFAAAPRVGDDALLAVAAAFTGLATTQAGPALLQAIGVESLIRAGNADYDDVRGLGIPRDKFAAFAAA